MDYVKRRRLEDAQQAEEERRRRRARERSSIATPFSGSSGASARTPFRRFGPAP